MIDNPEGVILAAGLSRRTGLFKMALKLGEKTLIQRCIESMMEVCSRIIVVTGYQNRRIDRLIQGYRKVKVVYNANYKKGMFSSVQTGVSDIQSSWFFLTPGDYPLLNRKVYRRLLKARDNTPGKTIFIPVFQGRKGHPILLHRDIIREIMEEPQQSNLRIVIGRLGFEPVEMIDDSILLDIDTLEDYHMATDRLFSRKRNL